ncbi:MAG: helix-turn-helix domain-containing protein [Candidatus Binatia bacterium]
MSWLKNVNKFNVLSFLSQPSAGSTLDLPEQWEFDAIVARELSPMPGLTLQRDTAALPRGNASIPDGITLAEFEKAQILRVLNEVHWRIEGPTGAAASLGLHPNTLRSRMRRLAAFGISR